MTRINLLPTELRPAKKKKVVKRVVAAGPVGIKGDPRLAIKAVVLLIAGLFTAITLFFYFDYLNLRQKQTRVAADFAAIQPSVQEVKVLEQEVTTILQPEKDFLNAHVLNKAAITSILQKMSESLPEGLWLTAFNINNSGKQRSFQIQGVALNSKEKTNIQLIEEYLQQIKQIIPSAEFTYSTGKKVEEKVPVTTFSAKFQWQAD